MVDDGLIEFGYNLSIQTRVRYIELYTDHPTAILRKKRPHKRFLRQQKKVNPHFPKWSPFNNTTQTEGKGKRKH